MIVSASYKTDIPAFYGEWFVNRMRAGFCRVLNPINRRPFTVSLRPIDVDGIVFWTKNVGPFLPRLSEVLDHGFPFIVQHTITGYPRELESAVIDPDGSVAHMQEIADKFGARVAVWRYDPIVFSSLTPPAYHRHMFSRLARGLRGVTDEVVVSVVQVYKKTQRNMDWASSTRGFEWDDPPQSDKISLLHDLAEIARANGIEITVCSQPEFLVECASEARCVDAQRLSEIAGAPIRSRVKGNRPGCACFESRDIGDYDTCPHGCVYCYAVRSRDLARDRYRAHDPHGEFLFPVADERSSGNRQGRFFSID